MSIFRESFLNEGFMDNIKKRIRKNNSKSTNKTPKELSTPTISEDEVLKIVKVIKDRVKFHINRFNKDPKIQQIMRDLIKEGLEKYSNYEDVDNIKNSIPKLEYKIFEDGFCKNSRTDIVWYETIFLIFDLSQSERIILSDIIYDLADELRNDNELKKLDEFNRVSFDCGDGDEGCLYVSINMY